MAAETTPWRHGRLKARSGAAQLLFGRMHEDWTLERSLFSPGSRVFCIASAGCTSLALAAYGHRVDAVDINPEQVRYVRERLAGASIRHGMVDRMLSGVRNSLSWCRPNASDIRRFLLLENTEEQVRFWLRSFPLHRSLLSLALNPLLLRALYNRRFVHALPSSFGSILCKRFERGFAIHSNRLNSFAWRLFLGCDSPFEPEIPPITHKICVTCADAVEFLERSPSNTYEAFSLSNILDGAGEEYRLRLQQCIERAARPGALLVLRSLREPRNPQDRDWAVQDRAMIWGSVRVTKVKTGGEPCFTL